MCGSKICVLKARVCLAKLCGWRAVDNLSEAHSLTALFRASTHSPLAGDVPHKMVLEPGLCVSSNVTCTHQRQSQQQSSGCSMSSGVALSKSVCKCIKADDKEVPGPVAVVTSETRPRC